MSNAPLQSIFKQQLDRAVFITYLLGAVVPLLALGYVVSDFVLPAMAADSRSSIAMVSAVAAVSVLSLASFLALRRITGSAVTRMKAEGERLSVLLETSRRLAQAPHAAEATETAVRVALELCGADCAFALLRGDEGKPLALHASAGDGAPSLYAERESEIVEWVETVLGEQGSARIEDAISGSLVAIPFHKSGHLQGALVLARGPQGAPFMPESIDAAATLATLAAVAFENADLRDAQRNFFAHLTDLVVTALDCHVDHREGHSWNVARVANALGRELGLSDTQLEQLHFASLLHDIGMLRVSAGKIREPAQFRRHPQLGHRILSRIRVWERLAPIVLHHHENFDGTGYPEGLQGDDIEVEARIIRVADAFDAMTRDEPHRKARGREEALDELRRYAGIQFDPAVVAAFQRLSEGGRIPV